MYHIGQYVMKMLIIERLGNVLCYILARDCGVPDPVVNRTLTVVTQHYPGSAVYKCLEGHVVTGSDIVTDTIQCDANGIWQSAPIECQRKYMYITHV